MDGSLFLTAVSWLPSDLVGQWVNVGKKWLHLSSVIWWIRRVCSSYKNSVGDFSGSHFKEKCNHKIILEKYSYSFLPMTYTWSVLLEEISFPFYYLEEWRVIHRVRDFSECFLILDVEVFIYLESWFWSPDFLSRFDKCLLFCWLYCEVIRLDLGQV